MNNIIVSIMLYSSIVYLPQSYEVRCNGTLANGLSWKVNQWEVAKFTPDKYTLRKIPQDRCLFGKLEPSVDVETLKSRGVCISINRTMGEQHKFGKICNEIYSKDSSNDWVVEIHCEDLNTKFSFVPNGWFHKSSLSGTMEDLPRNNYKDSQYVEVGRCGPAKLHAEEIE